MQQRRHRVYDHLHWRLEWSGVQPVYHTRLVTTEWTVTQSRAVLAETTWMCYMRGDNASGFRIQISIPCCPLWLSIDNSRRVLPEVHMEGCQGASSSSALL
ncbi:hypothetical protein DVH05_017722 [Phytophthora capsici]|nr:hypothetical protein DVH05_017722 [Phytophthora capsici]